MDPTALSEKQKNILFWAVVLFLIFAGWNINNLLSSSGLTSVSLHKTPFDSVVRIDGVEVKGDTLKVKPGEYTLEISRDGFYTKELPITVTEDGPEFIPIALGAATEEAKKLTEEDERYAYSHATSDAEIIDPIIATLPVGNLLYNISVDRTLLAPDKPVTIIITAPAGYRSGAINKIKQLGFDVSKYSYTFPNYENPFK